MSDVAGGARRGPDLIHRAAFYGSDEEFLAATGPYVADGLRAGEAVLVVTTPANMTLLGEFLPREAGSVDFVDSAAGWYTSPPRTLVAYDDYVRGHERRGRSVRVVGEPIWDRRGPLERRAWQRLESLVNLAFPGRNASWLCPYDVRALDADVLAAARRSHPQVAYGADVTRSAGYVDPGVFCAEYGAEPLPEPTGTVVELPFSADDLTAAREFASRQAYLADLPKHRVADLVLAVNEITTNAVRHGGGHGRVRAWRDDHSLVFEVEDDGGGRPDPLAGALRPPVEGHRDPGGRGLWTARQLSDLLEIRHGPGWLVRLYANLR